ncbi:afadin- and alpha-actinin-binding protein B [Polymixia lowei]
MASRRGQRRADPQTRDLQDAYLLRRPEPSFNPLVGDLSHSASWRVDGEDRGDGGPSLREELVERDRDVVRLRDALRCEKEKSTRLQLRRNQQEAELRRREQHSNRLRERLSQLTDRHREKGPSIEVLNLPLRGRGKTDQGIKSARTTARREEAALSLMLERREAELREAMKLRHSLTTLLHALRVDMEQTLQSFVDDQEEVQGNGGRLVQAELALGDHVTGGVVQGWTKVRRRLGDFLVEGHTAVGTDQDKLLAQLETELKESQQLVKLQQQLLQDGLVSPVPFDLADSYFLEERERIQARWAELDHQRRNFERERQSFTDAAIRLSHEQQFLCESLLFGKGVHCKDRIESTALDFSGLDPMSTSGCPLPSPTDSGTTALAGSCQGRVRVQTPSTPDLYSALKLPYRCSASEGDQPEPWDGGAERMLNTPHVPRLDWSF